MGAPASIEPVVSPTTTVLRIGVSMEVLHRLSLKIAYENWAERKRQTEHTSSYSESSLYAIPTALVRWQIENPRPQ